jgi:mitogen-activated protein kinase 1/3
MAASTSEKVHSFVIKGCIFEVYERYKNLQPIGSGAYGVVCSAIDSKHQTRVAIKKVQDVFQDLVDAKRILREIKLLAHFTRQDHDNIIAIRDLFTMPPDTLSFTDVYIVTDLMESDLQKIVASRQPLTESHVRYFVYELLRGIQFIHSASVLHRDLKPRFTHNTVLSFCNLYSNKPPFFLPATFW